MRFNFSEWGRDIVTGVLTGAATGFVGSLLLPIPGGPVVGAAVGAFTGLVGGALQHPIKWAWGSDEPPDSKVPGAQPPAQLEAHKELLALPSPRIKVGEEVEK